MMVQSAAMLVRDSGSRMSKKKRTGAGAVHPRRLGQFVRDRQEELAVEEGAGRRRDQRQDEAGIGIEQPEVQRDLDAGDFSISQLRPVTSRIA